MWLSHWEWRTRIKWIKSIIQHASDENERILSVRLFFSLAMSIFLGGELLGRGRQIMTQSFVAMSGRCLGLGPTCPLLFFHYCWAILDVLGFSWWKYHGLPPSHQQPSCPSGAVVGLGAACRLWQSKTCFLSAIAVRPWKANDWWPEPGAAVGARIGTAPPRWRGNCVQTRRS